MPSSAERWAPIWTDFRATALIPNWTRSLAVTPVPTCQTRGRSRFATYSNDRNGLPTSRSRRSTRSCTSPPSGGHQTMPSASRRSRTIAGGFKHAAVLAPHRSESGRSSRITSTSQQAGEWLSRVSRAQRRNPFHTHHHLPLFSPTVWGKRWDNTSNCLHMHLWTQRIHQQTRERLRIYGYPGTDDKASVTADKNPTTCT